MKLAFYTTAAQQQTGSRADNQHLPTKQSHASFLRTLFLLAIMLVGGVGVSWGQTLPTTRKDLGSLGSDAFVLVNANDGGKILYGTDAQNAGYNFYSTAVGGTYSGYTFVLETPQNGSYDSNDYLLKFKNKDGNDYSLWGNSQCYLNSQPGGNIFILGNNGKIGETDDHYTNGQDLNNGAVWTIIANGDGTYKLKNKGTDKYLNGLSSVDNVADAANWSFCTLGTGCKVDFKSNNVTMGTVTGKRMDTNEDVESGAILPYGTRLELTAHPESGYVFKNWSNGETGLTRVLTVTGNGDPSGTFEAGFSVTFNANNADWGTVTATVNGSPITSGSSVAANSKVTFTATPKSSDYLTWGWAGDATNYAAQTEITITKDVTVTHNFTPGIKINAYPNNGSLGSINISGGGKSGTNIHITPWAGPVTFTATPNAGVTFDGWYNDVDCTDLATRETTLTYTNSDAILTNTGTINRWAKFEAAPALKTIGKPECNHYGSRTHGDNYFDINQLNVAEGVTIAKADPGQTVTVPTNGGYMSYAFEQEYNLGDLVKWTISDNTALRARVSNVEFLDAEGNQLVNCFTDAGNRINVGLDVQSKLKKVKEIRIHFKESNEEHQYTESIPYTFEWIRFSFEHSDRTLPTLKDGTAAEMEIYETTSLVLSNSPGYWRQFPDGTSEVAKADGLIPTNEWQSYYKLDNMQQGDYYFGARDGGTCALGYSHETELVKVHVNVKALDIYGDIVTTEESSDKKSGSYTAPDLALVYGKKIGEADVTINVNKTRNEWDSACGKGVKLNRDWGTELIVNAPNGYRVQKVDITFGHDDTKYNLSMNRGNKILEGEGSSISYTNLSEYDYVRMVVCNEASEEQKEVHVTNVKVYLVPVNAKIIDESRDITVEGVDRKYWLYVPENVKNGTHKNVAVVFALHGGGEDYEPTHNGQLNFNSLADANNFIVVYPRAAEHLFPHFNGEKARAWEATGAVNNDTKLFEAIIEELRKETTDFTIDPNKVYMAGFSVGGMMAYATATVLSDKFAAFASISGLPMNEVHQRTHNDRPVPFLHVHGTKDNFVRYEHMATIVDNMLTRNGLDYTPTATAEGDADIWSDTGKTRYKKYAYGNEADKTATPYIYYQIGTGMTASDTGMGHNHWCNIGGKDVKQVMWEFFSGRSLQAEPAHQSYFKAKINLSKTGNEGNQLARDHGWNVPTQGSSFGGTRLLAQYGESGGYSVTDENVYHTIQLPEKENLYLKLKATGGVAGSFINVRIVKLGDVNTYFDKLPAEYVPGQRDVTFPITEDVVLDTNYDTNYSAEASNMCINFSTAGRGIGEYRIIITKSGLDDAITIDGISIDNFGTPSGHVHEGKLDTDFGGFFSYNNRLCAQWNFDLSDPFRFNVEKVKASIAANAGFWEANYENTNTGNAGATMGTVVYTYTGEDLVDAGDDAVLGNYRELTYDGVNKVPVAAGLKFKADEAGHVSIQVTLSNGKPVGTQLVVDQHVKMYIPYVENSYRPDNGFGGQVNEKVSSAEDADIKDAAKHENYDNCLPHHKRDIIYMSLANGTVWDEWKGYWEHGHVINKCIDDPEQALFHSGGEEFINDKKYYKMNYLGKQGTPCIMQFRDQTIIDRIGVNRNLTYSFYSEYISELGITVPQPRTRIVGSPKGLKVANIGDTEGKYGDCIALTYGGWPDDRTGYSAYTPYDGHEGTLDRWSELGVYNGGEKFYTWANMPEPSASDDVPIATDGFPVFSRIDEPAHSETVMNQTTANTVRVYRPELKDKDREVIRSAGFETLPSYHPANDGKINLGTYQENVTPWSLPCRGAYLKFEPSRPGVLNVHILQRAYVTDRDNNVSSTKATYYIADEFGKLLDSETVFCKTAMKGEPGITKVGGGFQINETHSDYAKYSFNVYPGKTYYMFSNEAGVGMTGFYYEPDVYRYDNKAAAEAAGKDWEFGRRDIRMKTVTLSDDQPYSFPSGLTATETLESPDGNGGHVDYPVEYSEKAVTVNYERTFKANTWNSICLPFSMNQVEMESVFGKGTTVIMLRDIQPAYRMPDGHCTLNYIYHENQDIIAGYPYFIKPTQKVDRIEVNACLYETTPSIVNISSEGPLTVPSFTAKKWDETTGELTNEDKTFTLYEGISGWTFHGTYKSQTIPVGAYALDGGGGLATWDQEYTLKPYRALLDLNEGSLAKAMPRIEVFGMGFNMVESDYEPDNIATSIDIDAMLSEQGIFPGGADVYSIDGKKLRTGVTGLQQLPKGVYIINKKKYVVK